ncbi:MAG: hypothetical protein U1E65_35660 [Myxococcota bacterium]
MRRPLVLGLVLASALCLPARQASAHATLQLVGGLTAAKTEWGPDFTGVGTLKIGFLPLDWLSIFFMGKLGYGGTDSRMLTLVSVGLQLYPFGEIAGLKPYGRMSIGHQHEESLSVVRDDPFGALFGIGDGIRHRGGFEWAAGFDLPVKLREGWNTFVSFEATTIWFYDDRGPHWYIGAGAGLGANFEL